MKVILAVILILGTSTYCEMNAFDIMEKVKNRPKGNKIESKILLTLNDKFGKTRNREFVNYYFEGNQIEMTLMVFIYPADIRNTSFLIYSYDDDSKTDDQWMYSPADKRIRRISSRNKRASFMGTDLNYSDLASPVLSNYKFTILDEAEIDGQKTWIIQSIPINDEIIKQTGYKQNIAWVRKDLFIIIRSMHYTDDGKIKYMTINKMDQKSGIWVLTEMEIKTMKGNELLSKTIMSIDEISFNNDFDETKFTQQKMQQGK